MNKIIKELARKYGDSPENIEQEMRRAIMEAMRSLKPEARSFWKSISPEGDEPSLEIFLNAVSDMVINDIRGTLKESAE